MKSPPSLAKNGGTRGDGGTGTILQNKYQLGHLLGRGNFAKVYHGHNLIDTTNVAIKVIDKTTTITTMEPLIIREISAMRRLNHHPNILQIHEVMATKTKIYLVMELAPKGELFMQLQRKGRFSEATARSYFHQFISALQFCHKNGVAHRDIKPQNILLDGNGRLKISDFGLSALPEHLKNGMLHTTCGTPAYTAPEVVYRKGYDGAKADAWSSGVILFAFLAGTLPFDDSDLPSMYRAMHRRVFNFPDWISKPARKIICLLLDPNPNTRLSIQELVNLSWFKRSAQGGTIENQDFSNQSREKELKFLRNLNAFDIISMSSGLDLSGIFEVGSRKKEIRFTSNKKVKEIEERVMAIGKELGCRVKRGKGGGINLIKGRMDLAVELWEVVANLWFVELKVNDGGLVEVEEFQWNEMEKGLTEVVLSWPNVCKKAI
ncbi:non-receptor serine/threonine protein kinase [Lithospermum erythrorhizon]|uniref:non-specific serine/threonine protein kinase n=1 Tax=Lithospermum erythrorhizon TaxID=34254 RepID=A0AAV3PM92_LITER